MKRIAAVAVAAALAAGIFAAWSLASTSSDKGSAKVTRVAPVSFS